MSRPSQISYEVNPEIVDTGKIIPVTFNGLDAVSDDLSHKRSNSIWENHIKRLLQIKESLIQATQSCLNLLSLLAIDEKNIDEKISAILYYEYYDEAKTLETLIQKFFRSKMLPLSNLIYLIRSICNGVNTLHSHNLIHRDLKPSNILGKRNSNGVVGVKIMDHETVCPANTSSNEQIGTHCGFTAPECYKSGTVLTFASDVFSLAGIFCYILSGGEIDGQLIHFFNMRERSIEYLNSKGFSKVTEIISKALFYDPDKRYQDVSAFSQDLINALIQDWGHVWQIQNQIEP